MFKFKGAYSLVIMSPTKLIAARDPQGFRPLCMGSTPDGKVVFASETCALDSVGAEFVRNVEPGEIVVADKEGVKSIKTLAEQKPRCAYLNMYIFRDRIPLFRA